MTKKAIGTFKDHFQAILAGVDNTFLMHLWDRLLPQAETTLNMLRPINLVPTISAYTYMYQQHNFNRIPSAPMGCSVMLHNKLDIRKTWDNHTIKGYYIKTSRDHYRCYKIWVKNTRSIQIADTMLSHRYITVLEISKTDAIVVAVNHLAKVLQGEKPANIGETSKKQLT